MPDKLARASAGRRFQLAGRSQVVLRHQPGVALWRQAAARKERI
jgi:hypothetical protein